ncbi:MAG: general secretion pathway protein GspE, partial [Desulfobacterales bacterium]|nr:general secretion pathway protein GspE [Desulfobacterales bacterium]
FLVSSVMIASFAQRLVRTVCPQCKKPYKPPLEVLQFWGLDESEDTNFMQGKGCFNCLNTGYKGRTGIYEVLVIDDLIQKLIIKNSTSQEITRAAVSSGTLNTLKENAADKVRTGITTFEEASSAVLI